MFDVRKMAMFVAVALCAGGLACAQTTAPAGPSKAPRKFLTLTSTAFEDSAVIPVKFDGVETGVSPPLSWINTPAGTQSFTILMHDLEPAPKMAVSDITTAGADLERPRDAPLRTAIGIGVFTFVAMIFLAGSADRIDVLFGWSYTSQIWTYRIAIWLLPLAFGAVAHRVCVELLEGEQAERSRRLAEEMARRDEERHTLEEPA